MAVAEIEHINIVTDRLEETIGFYTRLLGLERGTSPVVLRGMSGGWLHVPGGPAIIHLVGYIPARHDADGITFGTTTGALHHIALKCREFAAILARAEEMGLAPQVNDRTYGDLRQIFVHDPNGIRLELNFSGE